MLSWFPGRHNFLPENPLKLVYDSTFLDIDEKILNYLMQVKRGGFNLML